LQDLNAKYQVLNGKIQFLCAIIDGTIVVYRRTSIDIATQIKTILKIDDTDNNLTKMPISSFTEENLLKLKRKKDKIEATIKTIEGKSPQDIWLEDLDQFEEAYKQFIYVV